jgi:hypothetical protein
MHGGLWEQPADNAGGLGMPNGWRRNTFAVAAIILIALMLLGLMLLDKASI